MSLLSDLRNVLSGGARDSEGLAFGAEEDKFKFTFSDKKDVKLTANIDKLSDIDVKYPLIEPFAYAHIVWDEDENSVVYRVIEPDLESEDREALKIVKENLSEKIDTSLNEMQDREKIISHIEEKLKHVLPELGLGLTEEQRDKINYYLYRDFVGLGKIEPFMHDPYVEDIGCESIGTPIFGVHSEFGTVKTDIVFNEENELESTVIKLAERCGRNVSYADPLLEGRLSNGSRVNASLTEDVTSQGSTFSIRKLQDTPLSAIDMMDLGTASPEMFAYLWICQQYQKSVLVAGGTATGKTSFLNAAISFIPPDDKIISIEETRELQPPHENWIPSITREMFGNDDIDMDDLLKESFPQNPDYILVEEVRGKEASSLFKGMSSGHASLSTIHASSPNAVIERLNTPPISLPAELIEAIDVIVLMTHAKGVEESARRVKSIHELQNVVSESSSAQTSEAFTWTATDDSFNQKEAPYLFDEISNDYGISKQKLQKELEQRTHLLTWLQDKGVKNFDKVSEIIAEYYQNKEEILDMINTENDEYSPEDIIQAETKADPSHHEHSGNSMKKSREKNVGASKQKYHQTGLTSDVKLDSDSTLTQKKTLDKNPVAELEKRLKSEEKTV